MKYLVIGSAPYIQDWYKKNGKKYLDAGYKLVAINNAWAIDPDNMHFWVHANDFYKVAKVIPDMATREALDNKERVSDIRGISVYHYHEKQHGTMILNVLVGLINRAKMKDTDLEVCVAGCDLIYNGEVNHFYGNGTADPLRLGEDYLKVELQDIKGYYEKEGFGIFNVGGQPETLLPFDRKEL